MSRRKRRPRHPRIITQNGPTNAVIGVRVPPEQIEAARREGRAMMSCEVDAKTAALRADAASLERAADVLSDASLLSGMGAGETGKMLAALAAGIRYAADRLPSDIPF